MARQIERANNLARLLDVTESFGRDARGVQNWESVLRLYADYDRFLTAHETVTAETVLYFYVLDRDNPNSVASNIHLARENARALRPLISTEMWTQINVFQGELRALKRRELSEEKLNMLAAWIKESCQLQSGIIAETLYRDEAWFFYDIGRHIERADQTTRLVDNKYQLLLPEAAPVGSPVDVAQWNALLRSAAAFQAFRRVHHRGMTPARVAGFLIFNNRFPRSVAASVKSAAQSLYTLRQTFALDRGQDAQKALDRDKRRLDEGEIDKVIDGGLHEYLDTIQRQMIEITDLVAQDFFPR